MKTGYENQGCTCILARCDKHTENLRRRADGTLAHDWECPVSAHERALAAQPDPDYTTDTARHPFAPSTADAALCASCGECKDWHPAS